MTGGRRHSLATIPGDGIGPEVVRVAVAALDRLAAGFGFELDVTEYPFGADHYLATGEVLTPADIAALRRHDAILLGACGDPRVPPGVLERGLVVALRLAFDQYVNVRPVKLLPGVRTPFADLDPARVDLVVLRENTEGLYAGGGGVTHRGTPDEVATQVSVSTRAATERLVRHGFRLARTRRRRLTLCHKTNILTFAGDLWERTVADVAREFPDVETDYVHVDAMTLHLVTRPERFDVVVTDNLFGDILTDLAAVLQGGLGFAPSASIAAEPGSPSTFEPVHGSAPDIAGTGTANPVAALLTAALLLDHLGEEGAARALESAVEDSAGALAGAPATTSEIAATVDESLMRYAASPGGQQ